MKLVFAADHGGFALKAELVTLARTFGHEIEDLGVHNGDSVDYPDFAHRAAELVKGGKADRAILVCGSGVGMSLAANKHAGIRAVVCSDVYTAKMSRAHNDANVLCLGARVVGSGLAAEIFTTWLNGAFEGGRHAGRVAKIEPPSK
ncbi:MAG: ribose 5-phosphate isomerase B [Polyangiaceae bacterium]